MNEMILLNQRQTSTGEEDPMALSGCGSQTVTPPQRPSLKPVTWLRTELLIVTVSAHTATGTPALPAFNRSRSALEPMTWPRTEAAIVNAIAVLGIKTDFLSMAMNGTAACTATNHDGENFSVCSLHTPKGTLAAMPKRPIVRIFDDRGWGRRFFTKAVRARAALAATTACGHLKFIPGGGCRVFATKGKTLLTALYDLAIGQFPVSSHSLLRASCDDLPSCKNRRSRFSTRQTDKGFDLSHKCNVISVTHRKWMRRAWNT